MGALDMTNKIEYYSEPSKEHYIQCPKCNDLVSLQELREANRNTEAKEEIAITGIESDNDVVCPYCNEVSDWESGMGWNEGRSLWQRVELNTKESEL